MLPQFPARSRRPSRTPTCTKVKSTSASPRFEGASTQILDVDEMPPPIPSSWRPCSGSGDPMAAGRIAAHSSVDGGRSEARSTRPVEVPLRTNSAGRLRCPFFRTWGGIVDMPTLFGAVRMVQLLRSSWLPRGLRRWRCLVLAAAIVCMLVYWAVVTYGGGFAQADTNRRVSRRLGPGCGGI
ncbi:hypothetical protein EV127DRAFT_420811 [Xylaria flabelliformis]|nr:hypothetical protein EV127DRAFT_420811 [Xylaria flabelliformis]